MPIDPSTAFVSYGREDMEFAVRVAKDLKAKGARVWMDKIDIRPGQRWEIEVETALDGCRRMLVILSPASIDSKNVLAEAAFAIDEGKEVIPVLYRECKIPFRLRPFQYADFRTDYAVGLSQLLVSLSAKDEQSPTGTEPQRTILLENENRPKSVSYTVGAQPHGGGTRFKVWAPGHKTVEVIVFSQDGKSANASYPLRKDEKLGIHSNLPVEGIFCGDAETVKPGDRYKYRVDGKGPFPDPASRHQPQAADGTSQVVDPTLFKWNDQDWPGVSLKDLSFMRCMSAQLLRKARSMR